MATRGFLGIDAGTQGLSVVFADESLNVIATGDGGYEMVEGLGDGCYEQHPNDWIEALKAAMNDLRAKLTADSGSADLDVLAIGISGQMHGEVLIDENGQAIKPARLWCDARNDEEGTFLTQTFNVKMPKRLTAVRWLWTLKNQPDVAAKAQRITTPAGWLAFCLTGEHFLGIGDAAGMFPIDQSSLNYDPNLLDRFNSTAALSGSTKPLESMLPVVKRAGEEGGKLHESGAAILGLPPGIPLAPAEGDQPASLAGSLIGDAGMVSVSFGTSVCANSVGDKPFEGVSKVIDHFCDPDGKPINMVFLRNGTTFMNSVVAMFGRMFETEGGSSDVFAKLMPQVVAAKPDCGGLLAVPFMDDEPGLGVDQGGSAMLFGIHSENATPANAVKAAMIATMFNLRIGSEALDRQGFPRTELVLSGGLAKTPALGQDLADIMNTNVTLLAGADEGCAWGAALMAKYRASRIEGNSESWSEFLRERAQTSAANAIRFTPIAERVEQYDEVFVRYKALLHKLGIKP